MHSAQCVATVGQYQRVPLGKSQISVGPGTVRRIANLGSRQGLAVTGRGVVIRLTPSGGQTITAYVQDGGITVVTIAETIDSVEIDTLTTGTPVAAYAWIVDLASLEAANPRNSSE